MHKTSSCWTVEAGLVLELVLPLVAAVGGVPKEDGLIFVLVDSQELNRMRCAIWDGRLLEKLLDKVDVGHHHAAAAVPPEAELIHGVTFKLLVTVHRETSPGTQGKAYPSFWPSSRSRR